MLRAVRARPREPIGGYARRRTGGRPATGGLRVGGLRVKRFWLTHIKERGRWHRTSSRATADSSSGLFVAGVGYWEKNFIYRLSETLLRREGDLADLSPSSSFSLFSRFAYLSFSLQLSVCVSLHPPFLPFISLLLGKRLPATDKRRIRFEATSTV